jgi:hypothetical protein
MRVSVLTRAIIRAALIGVVHRGTIHLREQLMYCIRVLDYKAQDLQGVASAGFSVGDIPLVRPAARSTLVGWARDQGPFDFWRFCRSVWCQ